MTNGKKEIDKKLHNIYMIGGEKGGVGKTFVSRSLCQYLKSQGTQFALVEADAQINDVGRIYASEAAETATITLSDDETMQTEPDVIFNLAVKHPVLVNLPSNTLDVLEAWIDRVSLLKFMETEYEGNRLVKWFVSDGCYESVRQLERSVNQLSNAIPHIIVLNRGRLNGRDFSYLDDSEIYQRVKEAPNFVTEIEFPSMESNIQYFIDSNELTLSEAMQLIQAEMGVLSKQRVKTFIDKLSEGFGTAFSALKDRGLIAEQQVPSLADPPSENEGNEEEGNEENDKEDPERGNTPDTDPTSLEVSGQHMSPGKPETEPVS